ncbi:hypothetical protein HK099_005805 [Clydaea vesicula]|uniref:Ribosome biogenesis protein SLX9 n=1 Tax=Clydaea vesicula TaxID=447962 RepID=A0AAD5U7M7_9FUNG|nr:hypothetical protein HK099_005805 [Clydaea vesicula]
MGKIVKERSYKTSGPGNKEVTLENFGGSKSCSLGKKEWKKQKKEMWLKKVADFLEKKDKKFNNKKKKMSEIPNMDSFKEAMLEITKNEEQKPKEEKNIKINKKAVSQKHRRKVALEEITRVQKILKYKKFSENPISIIQAHINNTIANYELEFNFFKDQIQDSNLISENSGFGKVYKVSNIEGKTVCLKSENLCDILTGPNNEGSPLPNSLVESYFKDLVNGLNFLHSWDIAHLDIKPENLLIEKSTNNLLITDFGSSININKELPQNYTPYISEFWSAPELNSFDSTYFDDKKKFFKCDIFSCGLIFLAMYHGYKNLELFTNNCSVLTPSNISKAIQKIDSENWRKTLTEMLAMESRSISLNFILEIHYNFSIFRKPDFKNEEKSLAKKVTNDALEKHLQGSAQLNRNFFSSSTSIGSSSDFNFCRSFNNLQLSNKSVSSLLSSSNSQYEKPIQRREDSSHSLNKSTNTLHLVSTKTLSSRKSTHLPSTETIYNSAIDLNSTNIDAKFKKSISKMNKGKDISKLEIKSEKEFNDDFRGFTPPVAPRPNKKLIEKVREERLKELNLYFLNKL